MVHTVCHPWYNQSILHQMQEQENPKKRTYACYMSTTKRTCCCKEEKKKRMMYTLKLPSFFHGHSVKSPGLEAISSPLPQISLWNSSSPSSSYMFASMGWKMPVVCFFCSPVIYRSYGWNESVTMRSFPSLFQARGGWLEAVIELSMLN